MTCSAAVQKRGCATKKKSASRMGSVPVCQQDAKSRCENDLTSEKTPQHQNPVLVSELLNAKLPQGRR